MFLLADGSLLLNEIAPRPHNSGHYTIEACATSQYEQHLRAIMGWPLGDPSLVVGSRYMPTAVSGYTDVLILVHDVWVLIDIHSEEEAG